MFEAFLGAVDVTNITFWVLFFSVLLLVMILAASIFYKSTFNVDVIEMSTNSNGSNFKSLKAKLYIKKNNEYRLKIWNAKRNKILYNEESVKPELVYTQIVKGGKTKNLVFMSKNEEGFLVPMHVERKLYDKVVTDVNEKGEKTEKIIKTPVLSSEYGAVDVAWLNTEAHKLLEKYTTEQKFVNWILIILVIALVIQVGLSAWSIHQSSETAALNAETTQQLGVIYGEILVLTNATGEAGTQGSGQITRIITI